MDHGNFDRGGNGSFQRPQQQNRSFAPRYQRDNDNASLRDINLRLKHTEQGFQQQRRPFIPQKNHFYHNRVSELCEIIQAYSVCLTALKDTNSSDLISKMKTTLESANVKIVAEINKMGQRYNEPSKDIVEEKVTIAEGNTQEPTV